MTSVEDWWKKANVDAIHALVERVLGNDVDVCSIDDAVDVIRTLEAAQQSAAKHRRVTISGEIV